MQVVERVSAVLSLFTCRSRRDDDVLSQVHNHNDDLRNFRAPLAEAWPVKLREAVGVVETDPNRMLLLLADERFQGVSSMSILSAFYVDKWEIHKHDGILSRPPLLSGGRSPHLPAVNGVPRGMQGRGKSTRSTSILTRMKP